jgi:hypothetical protein
MGMNPLICEFVANCFYDKGIPCHDYRLKSHKLTDLKMGMNLLIREFVANCFYDKGIPCHD